MNRQLSAYLSRTNQFNKLLGRPLIDIDTSEGRKRLARCIDSELSPENLTCDGELSRSAVQRKYNELYSAAMALRAIDPTIQFDEV